MAQPPKHHLPPPVSWGNKTSPSIQGKTIHQKGSTHAPPLVHWQSAPAPATSFAAPQTVHRAPQQPGALQTKNTPHHAPPPVHWGSMGNVQKKINPNSPQKNHLGNSTGTIQKLNFPSYNAPDHNYEEKTKQSLYDPEKKLKFHDDFNQHYLAQNPGIFSNQQYKNSLQQPVIALSRFGDSFHKSHFTGMNLSNTQRDHQEDQGTYIQKNLNYITETFSEYLKKTKSADMTVVDANAANSRFGYISGKDGNVSDISLENLKKSRKKIKSQNLSFIDDPDKVDMGNLDKHKSYIFPRKSIALDLYNDADNIMLADQSYNQSKGKKKTNKRALYPSDQSLKDITLQIQKIKNDADALISKWGKTLTDYEANMSKSLAQNMIHLGKVFKFFGKQKSVGANTYQDKLNSTRRRYNSPDREEFEIDGL